jgi:hypothetical protein
MSSPSPPRHEVEIKQIPFLTSLVATRVVWKQREAWLPPGKTAILEAAAWNLRAGSAVEVHEDEDTTIISEQLNFQALTSVVLAHLGGFSNSLGYPC